MKTLLLMLHPAIGIVTMGLLLWMLAKLACDNPSYRMLKWLSIVIALLILGVWSVAGYWYVVYYPAEKAHILGGTMPWAHTVIMEIKEHLFLTVAIVGLYLPIVVISEGGKGSLDIQSKRLIRILAWVLLLVLFLIEGAGAIVTQGVKHGYMRGDIHETTL